MCVWKRHERAWRKCSPEGLQYHQGEGRLAYELFQFLVILVFQRCNLYHFLNSKKKNTAYDDNTYYRFLNEGRYNWRKFILLLSARIAAYFTTLTRENRARCLCSMTLSSPVTVPKRWSSPMSTIT